jgi:hypothetical protein
MIRILDFLGRCRSSPILVPIFENSQWTKTDFVPRIGVSKKYVALVWGATLDEPGGRLGLEGLLGGLGHLSAVVDDSVVKINVVTSLLFFGYLYTK